ncbi:MAG: YgjV family protein [Rhodospirillales bacterium]|nr:YgjV family protein [Rhodospirillales bacterium]
MSQETAQAFGWMAAAIGILSFQAKRREWLIALQAAACVLWATHFHGLGAIAGLVFNVMALARNLIALSIHRHVAVRWVLLAFVPAVWAVSAATWSGPADIIPPIAMTFSTLAQASRNVLRLRLLMLGASPCWLAYAALTGSHGGLVNESLNIVSITVGVLRHHVIRGPESSDFPARVSSPRGA